MMQRGASRIGNNGFDYSAEPHARKHGPEGYAAYETYKPWLRDEFVFRCAYCLIRERWYPNGQDSFSVDYFVSQITAPDRICDYDNLMYACVRCNSFKQDNTPLDPCLVGMDEHIRIQEDGTIEARTPQAHEHIQILGLDDPVLTEFRRRIIKVLQRLQVLSDEEATTDLRKWFGFPDHLPNLAVLRPPGGNTRPDGIAQCFYRQRQIGNLPDVY